jgi:hypothetical protein
MMNKKLFVLLLVVLSLYYTTLMAERVTLITGDVIEGVILSMESNTVRLKDPNGIVMEIEKDMIESIDYSTQQNSTVEPRDHMNVAPNSYQPIHIPTVPEPAAVSPINPYPVVHYDPSPFESGLLDPELEARKRMVTYNDQRRNPLLATSLSIVFPGTGHFYSHNIAAGFFFLGTRAIFTGMTWYGFSTRTDPNTGETSYNDILIGSAGAVGFVTMMILETIDSYSSAVDYNNNLRLKLGIDTLHENTVPVFDEQY